MDISQEYSSEFLRLFQISDAIVAVSKSMYNILIESGSFPNKTHLCPYGIDVDLFKLTVPSRNPLNFVCVGRFTEKKAPYLTILAFNEVLKIYPESKLIMIGGGSLVQVCKTIVESLNIQENVDFKGIMPVVEIVEELRSARAFVLHSLVTHEKDREGTPNVVIEASACGLPIVSTKHEGILDAVIHEKTGFLIKETDYLSMAKYMIELAKNEDLADELGQNGRYHILKNYNLNNSIAKLDNIIQSVLN
jgi:colanic acid/amylovoran biosynthesis glycosyltransferase